MANNVVIIIIKVCPPLTKNKDDRYTGRFIKAHFIKLTSEQGKIGVTITRGKMIDQTKFEVTVNKHTHNYYCGT